MRSRRSVSRWLGFLWLAVLWLPLLATEAQVRVPDKSQNTVPSFSAPFSTLMQSPVDVPANASLDYTGHAWECQDSYRRSGNACVIIDMPANASIDYSGHAWECQRSYYRLGNACAVVNIPANATLDYSGHGWECEPGYRRAGNACEQLTALPKTARYGSSAVQASRVHPLPQNDVNADIRLIQEQLKQAGFSPGPIDGILGSRTMKAFRRSLATREHVLTR